MKFLAQGAVFAIALLFLAAPASADSILDFAGPPDNFFATPSSRFLGDWESKTGTMVMDDAIVTSLIFLDGSTQNYYAKLFGVAGNDDAALGADVEISATFVNGVLDTSAANFLRISGSGTTFFEASLYGGDISGGNATFAFESTLGVNAAGTIDDSVSDWFAENHLALLQSGALIFNFDGIYTGSAGQGPGGVTELTNLNGKLTPTPEPASLALCGAAALGFVWTRRRRRA